jgi:hypothetical protein
LSGLAERPLSAWLHNGVLDVSVVLALLLEAAEVEGSVTGFEVGACV